MQDHLRLFSPFALALSPNASGSGSRSTSGRPRRPLICFAIAATALLTGCADQAQLSVLAGTGPNPVLPKPVESLFPTVNIAPAIGWPEGATPQAAPGLAVRAFAEGLDHPRWLALLPNGDVLVAETGAPPKPDDGGGIKGWIMGLVMKKAGASATSANRISLLRDTNGGGLADLKAPFIEGLNSPFGMELVGDTLYVANTDAVVAFAYTPGATSISAPGREIVKLPAGPINHHWTKNLIASKDGKKLYVTVGSNSNVGDNGMAVEQGRAEIWEVDIATGAHRTFASGLRNPNGLAWEPTSGALWTAVNERDEIGGDLVPDYMTSVKDGAFYGWPWSYWGQHVDERVKPPRPDMVAKAIAPDYALGPHTASLGLAWSGSNALSTRFQNGMFVGQHGSWNREPASGYKVIFVPFAQGKPSSAQPLDVLTGFLSREDKAHGRPVGVAIDSRGGLLVADDVGNKVWRVSAPAGGS